MNSIINAINRKVPRDFFGSWGMVRTSLYDRMVNNESGADNIESTETLEERIIFISSEKLQELLQKYTISEKFEMANIVSKEIKRRENMK